MKSEIILKQLKKQADEVYAKISQGFFKTGPGDYAEEDISR